MNLELATLTVRLGTAAQAIPAIGAFCAGDAARGRLLACWQSDIGELNQLIVLRAFDDDATYLAERDRCLRSADPYGCGEFANRVELQGYRAFPWITSIRSGALGPVYEIRTYEVKVGGLQPTLDAWQAALPAREAVSPCLIAMYALDGAPRITSIWPFASLEARGQARTDAVQQGVWPPKGGPAWLTPSMTSTIALPTAISPLR